MQKVYLFVLIILVFSFSAESLLDEDKQNLRKWKRNTNYIDRLYSKGIVNISTNSKGCINIYLVNHT